MMLQGRLRRSVSGLAITALVAAGAWVGLVPVADALETTSATLADDPSLADAVDESVDEADEAVDETIGSVDEPLDEVVETVEQTAHDPVGTLTGAADDTSGVVTGSEGDDSEPAPEPDDDEAPHGDGQDAAEDQQAAPAESTENGSSAAGGHGQAASSHAEDARPERRRPDARAMWFDSPALAMLDHVALAALAADSADPTPSPTLPVLAALPRLEYTGPVAGGPRSTAEIVDLLRSVNAFPSVIAAVLAPFPVAGPAAYSDDWGAPRFDTLHPHGRPHVGTDIFAPRGTPVIASADGTVTNLRRGTPIGGNSLRVTATDGTFFYYAHLEGFAAGVADGATVRRGDVLGFVGDSGNATGTPPHLHYQIHPGGGDPVPPVPYLDRWLADAHEAAAQHASAVSGLHAPQIAPPASSTSTAAEASPPPTLQAGSEAAREATRGTDLEGLARSGQTSPLSLVILLTVATLFVLLFRGSRRSPQAVASAPGFATEPVVPDTPADLLVAAGLVPAPEHLDVPAMRARSRATPAVDPLSLPLPLGAAGGLPEPIGAGDREPNRSL